MLHVLRSQYQIILKPHKPLESYNENIESSRNFQLNLGIEKVEYKKNIFYFSTITRTCLNKYYHHMHERNEIKNNSFHLHSMKYRDIRKFVIIY